MNGEILILFVILLLALVLCSFLGGSNCSTKEGFTSSNINGTYTGPNGEKAIVTDNSIIFTTNGNVITLTKNTSSQTYTGPNGTTATFDSSGNLTITDNQGNTVVTTNPSTNTSSTTNTSATTSDYDNYNHYNGSSYPTIYYGPNGSTARVINVDGQGKIVITNANGSTSIYYINNTGSSSSSSSSSTNVYKGPNGGTAIITTDSNGNQNVQITMPDGSKVIYTPTNTYVSNSIDPTVNQTTTTGSNGGQVTTVSGSSGGQASTVSGPNGGQAVSATGPSGNTAYAASGPNGASTVGTSNTYDSSAYYNSLPTGIPASQIPSGQEDLYILKSQVVPPVCPKCPDPILGSSSSFDSSKCPACPPCARCPEPAFDCKKVPNYNAFNPDYMPVPVLSDFSSFGM
jgi:hypothetical protein